jgi:hypothetical protein
MYEPTEATDPVFVDHTGRRRRVLTIAGCAGGALLTVTTVALLSGFTGVSPASLPGLPFGNAPGAATQPAPSPAGRPARVGPPTLPPASLPARTGATSGSANGSPSASPTTNGRRTVPTQTPSHHGKPR